MMRSIALLLNEESGDGSAADVESMLREAGADVAVFDVREPERATASGPERLVVAGGDGSIGPAADAASRAGIPIAVIPAGTANDFAAIVELPAELADACRLAVTGEELRSLELGRASGRPFVNVASIGLSPEAAEEAHGLKDRLGALAYPAGAVKAGASADPVECEVRCDGDVLHSGEAWQVSIACTGAFGGGASLATDTTDGLLDVVVIEGSSRARLVKHAYGLRVGNVEGQKGVIDARCAGVELRLDDSECLNIDGEIVPSSELAEAGTIGFRIDRDPFELVVG